jgi:hypothetical protein
MKNALKIIGFILAILLISSMPVSAQRGGNRGGINGSIGFVYPALTEKQKTDITSMDTKYRVEMDTLRAQLRRSTDIKKRGDLASKIQILSDTHQNDLKNVLTADQKISLETVNAMFSGRGGAGTMKGDTLRRKAINGAVISRGQMGGYYGRVPMMVGPMGRGNSFGIMDRRR